MRCDKCKWWVYLEYNDENRAGVHDDDKQGACKRLPPILDLTWFQTHLDSEHLGISYNDYRFWNQPVTEGFNWCGEFKPIKIARKP